MSCNGCRVLRKGCSDSCVLRPCLQWIDGAEAQGHATVFVAKFFGRAGLMSFISAVPESQRPALFQSLLFEACGRTVNPVNGAVGLMWTGRWHVCQSAVETVLRGGVLRPLAEAAPAVPLAHTEEAEESCTTRVGRSRTADSLKRKARECVDNHTPVIAAAGDWKLPMLLQAGEMFSPGMGREVDLPEEKRRPSSPEEKRRPSSPSEGSVTMSGECERWTTERKLLNLFV